MSRHDVIAYVTGELDPGSAAAIERAMASDPALREQVDGLRAVAERLDRLPAEAWQPQEPPPLAVPVPAPARARRLILRPAVAVACALALLALGGAAGALIGGDGPDPEPSVALEPVEPAGGGASGSAAIADGQVTLSVAGLGPPGEGGFYELWLLGDEGELVSLGSFAVDDRGDAKVTVPLPVDPARFRFLDVSREPADGDPGHSGASVLRGPATGA